MSNTSTNEPLNPRVWAVWAVAASLPALLSRNPLYLILGLLAVAVVRGSIGGQGRPGALPIWRLGLAMVAIATLWNALTVHYGETVVLTLPGWLPLAGGPITLEATLFGAMNGLAVWLLVAAFNTFALALTPYQMVSLAPRALRHAGLVVSIALSFFPRTLRTAREVREAQAVRGYRPRRVRDLTSAIVPVLLNSLESAAQIAEAMEARGYGRAASARSGIGWIGLLVGCLALLYWRESGAGWIVLGLSAGWLFVSTRNVPVSRYRRERRSAADALVGLACAVSIGMIVVAASGPSTLAYYPYPRLTVPSLDLALVAAVLALVAPAVSLPRLSQPKREPASQTRLELP